MQQVVLSGRQQWTRIIKFEFFLNFIQIFSFSPPPRLLYLTRAQHCLWKMRISAPNLRPTKTHQPEISGRKLLRPKPLESVPQFVLPLPSISPSNKAGWAFTVNCVWMAFLLSCFTSFPCRYRQKAGFAGPWEPATFVRRQEPTSSVMRTHRLMKRLI